MNCEDAAPRAIRSNFCVISGVNVGVSIAAAFGFLLLCLLALWWIFRTGYKLKG